MTSSQTLLSDLVYQMILSVFFGRPILWGLVHYGGEKGAREILELMRREINLAFALSGCTSVKDVTQDMVVHASYYSHL